MNIFTKKFLCLISACALAFSCFGTAGVFAADDGDETAATTAVTGFTVSGKALSEAVADGEITAATEVDYTGEALDTAGAVILALYNGDEFVTAKVADFAANTAPTASISLSAAGENAEWESYIIKAMIWDSTDTIKPITSVTGASLGNIIYVSSDCDDVEGLSYSTIGAAFDYLNANPPTREEERITLEVMPGTYREYVTLSAPYVTLKRADGETDEVLLTFYYASGNYYQSYQSGATAAGTQTSASVTIDSNAHDFIAENVTFENSYNRYVTDEETTDIIGGSTSSSRSQSQAVAIRSSADRSIFRNCKFYGRQDTLYIKDQSRCLFDECYVEGTVDFIFGDATAVFNNCEIYSRGGHLTAGGQSINNPYGYLFYNCAITSTSSTTLGRPWNGLCQVTWWNCSFTGTFGTGSSRFSTMSSSYPIDQARWVEYGNTDGNGNALASSTYASFEILPSDESVMINEYSPYNYLCAKYNKTTTQLVFDGWDPLECRDQYRGEAFAEYVAANAAADITDEVITESTVLDSGFGRYADIDVVWSSESGVVSESGQVSLGEYGTGVNEYTVTLSVPEYNIVRDYVITVASETLDESKVITFEDEEAGDFTESGRKASQYMEISNENYNYGGSLKSENINWGVVTRTDNIDAQLEGNSSEKLFGIKQTGVTELDESVDASKGIHDFVWTFAEGDDATAERVIEIGYKVHVPTLSDGGQVDIFTRSAANKTIARVTEARSGSTYSLTLGTSGSSNNNANVRWYRVKQVITSIGASEGTAVKVDYYVYDANDVLLNSYTKASTIDTFDAASYTDYIPSQIIVRPSRTATAAEVYIDDLYVMDRTAELNADFAAVETAVAALGDTLTLNYANEDTLPTFYTDHNGVVTWGVTSDYKDYKKLINSDGTINYSLCQNVEGIQICATLTVNGVSKSSDPITVNIIGNGESEFVPGASGIVGNQHVIYQGGDADDAADAEITFASGGGVVSDTVSGHSGNMLYSGATSKNGSYAKVPIITATAGKMTVEFDTTVAGSSSPAVISFGSDSDAVGSSCQSCIIWKKASSNAVRVGNTYNGGVQGVLISNLSSAPYWLHFVVVFDFDAKTVTYNVYKYSSGTYSEDGYDSSSAGTVSHSINSSTIDYVAFIFNTGAGIYADNVIVTYDDAALASVEE